MIQLNIFAKTNNISPREAINQFFNDLGEYDNIVSSRIEQKICKKKLLL